MAKKEKDIATNDVKITDPETGTELTFTAAEQFALNEAKRQIKGDLCSIAFKLRDIRDRKLYLLDECSSMQQWLLGNFQGSYSTFKNLMRVADAFYAVPDPERVSLMTQPITHLLLYARHEETREAIEQGEVGFDDEGMVVIEKGGETTRIPVTEFVGQIRKEITDEIGDKATKANDQFKKQKTITATKQQLVEHQDQQIEELQQKITTLEATITEMSHGEVDPAKLVQVTHRNEAIELLQDCPMQIVQLLGRIDNLNPDLVDAEVAGHFTRGLATVEAALSRIRDSWGRVLWVGPEGDSIPVVPGDDETLTA